ncbi:hypothetical protein, variant [Fonticula alba]|nr:hypothetical protein, variant [Fonticula alba]KCV72908.1 hypothetical protein, variant [Fonticula alba]|eukprot:XP_009492609.1 hypothetical protein, variant [Fonticula alba]
MFTKLHIEEGLNYRMTRQFHGLSSLVGAFLFGGAYGYFSYQGILTKAQKLLPRAHPAIRHVLAYGPTVSGAAFFAGVGFAFLPMFTEMTPTLFTVAEATTRGLMTDAKRWLFKREYALQQQQQQQQPQLPPVGSHAATSSGASCAHCPHSAGAAPGTPSVAASMPPSTTGTQAE